MDLSEYPAPIAFVYGQMEAEKDIRLKFRLLLKAFGVTLKYCALIILCDYIRLKKGEGGAGSHDIDSFLVKNIERPSMGHWNHIIREILKNFSEIKSDIFMPELFDFYYETARGKLSQTKNAALIESFISIRNLFIHPDILPDEKESTENYQSSITELNALLNSLSFLKQYRLVMKDQQKTQEFILTGYKNIVAVDDTSDITFELKNSTGSTLHLASFVHPKTDGEGNFNIPLLYESLKKNRVFYVLANEYFLYEKNDKNTGKKTCPYIATENIIDFIASQIKQDLVHTTSTNMEAVSFAEFQTVACYVSDKTYQNFIRDRKFNAAMYVERAEMAKTIDAFAADKEKKILAIVAESGLGKTSLFCKLTNTLQDKDNAVLFFSGKTYEGTSLDRMIISQIKQQKFFRVDLENRLTSLFNVLATDTAVTDRNKKLFIIFDGINEYCDPEKLLDDILKFSEMVSAHPWIKIIFSIRTVAWESLYSRHVASRESIFFPTLDDQGNPISYAPLLKFTADELENAYNKYAMEKKIITPYGSLFPDTKRLFTNPLLLKFAAEIYTGAAIPPVISIQRIFEEYAHYSIKERDKYFIHYLVEALWRMKRDFLLYEDFDFAPLSDEESRLLAPSINAHAADQQSGKSLAEKLRDYVYCEPVYAKETHLIACNNGNCPKYHIPILLPLSSLATGDSKCCSCDCNTLCEITTEDYCSTYDRLIAENFIQEFEAQNDCGISFNYDRMFEYLMGEFLIKYCLQDFPGLGLDLLSEIVTLVKEKIIFWGGLKNAVIFFLKSKDCSVEFWAEQIAKLGRNGEPDPLLDAALKSIFIAAFEECYYEDKTKIESILLQISAPPLATTHTMHIALDLARRILFETAGEELKDRQHLIEIIIRSLRFSDKSIRLAAGRVVFNLFSLGNGHKDLAMEIAEDLQKNIAAFSSLSGMLKLISGNNRNKLGCLADSMLNIVLFIAGAHFEDQNTRNKFIQMGLAIIKPFFLDPVISLGQKFIIIIVSKYVAKYLCDIYREKGPVPCNYLEMHLALDPQYHRAASEIGKLFSRTPPFSAEEKESLKSLSRIQNGLFTWYLFSLLSVFTQKEHEQDEPSRQVLPLLEEMYTNPESPETTRYIVIEVLLVLGRYSRIPNAEIEPLVMKYAEDMLRRYECAVTYCSNEKYDETIKNYVENPTKDGHPRTFAHEAYINKNHPGKHSFRRSYENSVLKNLFDYYLRIGSDDKLVSAIGFCLEILNSKKTDAEYKRFLTAWIEVCGEIGEQHPAGVVKILQQILDNDHDNHANSIYEQNEISVSPDATWSPLKALSKALRRIKRYSPEIVANFDVSLKEEEKKLLGEIEQTPLEHRDISKIAFYGQMIYHKSFLEFDEVRQVFGTAISKAARAKNVQKFFEVFIVEVLTWVARILKD